MQPKPTNILKIGEKMDKYGAKSSILRWDWGRKETFCISNA